MTYYTLEKFEKIMFDGFDYTLDTEVIDLIKNLAEKVGAPEYIKTPHFVKPNKLKAQQELCDEDWEALRKINKTEFVKKKGIEVSIDKIRVCLNKITDKTYIKQKNQIFEEIENIITYSGENLNLHLTQISKVIFDIASSNSFYSELYANIYNELVNQHDFIKTTLDEHFCKFEELFMNIEYVNPNDNYDLFCETNIINDKRRAVTLFYTNLMKKGLISIEHIVNIVNGVQLKLKQYIEDISKKFISEELSELIFILVINIWNNITDEDKKIIFNNINYISTLKAKDKDGLSNKTIFKHMDIKDALDKLN